MIKTTPFEMVFIIRDTMLNTLIKEKNISMYRLSKNCDIPYTTLRDICTERADLKKCSAETIYKLAKELNVSMEELLEPVMEHRPSFELFKSNVCHRLKEMTDIPFLIDVLKSKDIDHYFEKKWYPECLYLLAMLDYISRLNDVPLCTNYNHIRKSKLEKIVYPQSLLVTARAAQNHSILEQAYADSIPEFKRFNIVENEVRKVI